MQPTAQNKKDKKKKKKAKAKRDARFDNEAARRKAQSALDKSRAQNRARMTVARAAYGPKQMGVDPRVAEVMGALVDPGEYEPFRLPDGGAKTFVDKLRYKFELNGNGADVSLLTAGSGFGVLRRDPRCGLILNQYQSTAPETQYIFQSRQTNGTAYPAVPAGARLGIAAMTYLSGFAKHGPAFVPWRFADGFDRVFVQSEAAVGQAALSSFTVTGLTPSTSYTLNLYVTFAGQNSVVPITATSSSGGVGLFNIPAGTMGYASLGFGTALGAGCTITYSDNSLNSICHLAVPDLFAVLNAIDSLRVNSASLMLTDTTNVLTSQGKCASYQASGADTWESQIGFNATTFGGGLDVYTSLVSKNKNAFSGPFLKKGRYMPLKSTADPRDANLVPLGDEANASDIPYIDATQQLPMVIIAYNTGITTALNGEWTAWYHVEGESESEWFDTRAPLMHPAVLVEARHLLSPLDYDFENRTHIAKIWDWIKGAAQKVIPVASQFLPLLPPQYQAPAAAGLGLANYLTS